MCVPETHTSLFLLLIMVDLETRAAVKVLCTEYVYELNIHHIFQNVIFMLSGHAWPVNIISGPPQTAFSANMC